MGRAGPSRQAPSGLAGDVVGGPLARGQLPAVLLSGPGGPGGRRTRHPGSGSPGGSPGPRGTRHPGSRGPRGPGGFFRIFDFSPLDPLGGPGGPSGPTLERTIFYDFLKISFFGHKSSLFQSCAILVWTMRFSITYSIYEHIFTIGFRNFQIRCHSGTLRSHL